MTTAAPPKPSPVPLDYDPDDFRMTIGEHLEELRKRMILALVGFVIVMFVCLFFGTQVMSAFCAPLVNTLIKNDINPQLVIDDVSEGFMTYITISLISAAALASPWMLYQMWLFIGAGLYPSERKYVTKYLPLSIGLLITGMLFVYFFVLPWTLEFFIGFSVQIPMTFTPPTLVVPAVPTAPKLPIPVIPFLNGDPKPLADGMLYFDQHQQRLKVVMNGKPRVIAINSDNLLAPEIKLETYISLVIAMLITFGLSFQLPLVVLALERIGIIEIDALKKARKMVYFIMVIAAAVITPGDVITATVALMIPLCLLYELGILLARMGKKKDTGFDVITPG